MEILTRENRWHSDAPAGSEHYAVLRKLAIQTLGDVLADENPSRGRILDSAIFQKVTVSEWLRERLLLKAGVADWPESSGS